LVYITGGWAIPPHTSRPQDPNNPITAQKVALGKFLFHETAIGLTPMNEAGSGTHSCASCHHAWGGFQANLQQGIGEGGIGFGVAGEARTYNPAYPDNQIDVQPLRTPSAMNSAYQIVQLWNGQFGATGPNTGTDALWTNGTPIWNNHFGYEGVETQAIAGMGVHRLDIGQDFCHMYAEYEALFDICFPNWPVEERYSRITAGLAIAAYERTLLANKSPWQEYLRGDRTALTESEKRGAILFMGKAECVNCHNGPALNSMSFHALGMNDMEGNGTLNSSSELAANKGRGSFTQNAADNYKFKTPQLYNLKDSPFYGHGGTFTSLRDVITYKNTAMAENNHVPVSQLAEGFHPLNLSDEEIEDLVNFIENGLYDPDLFRYVPDVLPSGNCFPNADILSQIDQGCIQ
jgi:cytochrome c peroxidase